MQCPGGPFGGARLLSSLELPLGFSSKCISKSKVPNIWRWHGNFVSPQLSRSCSTYRSSSTASRRSYIPENHKWRSSRENPLRSESAAFKDICFSLLSRLDTLNSRNLAVAFTRIGSFGHLRDSDKEVAEAVLKRLTQRTAAQIRGMVIKDVAMVLHGLAQMGSKPDPELLRRLLGHLCAGLASDEDYEPFTISISLFALAKMGLGRVVGMAEEEAIAALIQQVPRMSKTFEPQNVANVLWALATMGREVKDVILRPLMDRTVQIAEQFDPQSLSSLLWAMATLGLHPGVKVMDALGKRILQDQEKYTSVPATLVLWSHATLGACLNKVESRQQHPAQRLDSRVAEAMASKACTGRHSPSGYAMLAWSAAALGLNHRGVVSAIAGVLEHEGRQGKVVDLEQMGWARHEMSAMHQFLLSCSLDPQFASVAGLFGDGARRQAPVCRRAFESNEVMSSKLQAEVAAAIKALGYEMHEERVDKETGCVVDIVLNIAGRAVAVEVDGPSHFLTPAPGGGFGAESPLPKGSTVLKRRHLASVGYVLVSVPHWEWDSVREGGKDAQGAYLRGLVKDALRVKR